MFRAYDWSPSLVVPANDYVRPSPDRLPGWTFYYQATTGGTTGTTRPNWPLAVGLSVTDGSVVWTCAAVAPYFDFKAFERRLGPNVVRSITADYDPAYADEDVLEQLADEGSSYVNEAIEPVFTLPILAPYPRALPRLALDAAVVFGADRHPEIVVVDDIEKKRDRLDAQLERLRKNQRTLGPNPPNPAVDPANQGGETDSSDPQDPTPRPMVFMNGTGIF